MAKRLELKCPGGPISGMQILECFMSWREEKRYCWVETGFIAGLLLDFKSTQRKFVLAAMGDKSNRDLNLARIYSWMFDFLKSAEVR
jgi:hypothetical protein